MLVRKLSSRHSRKPLGHFLSAVFPAHIRQVEDTHEYKGWWLCHLCQLLVERLIRMFQAGWSPTDSHHDICLTDLPCDPYPEVLKLIIFITNFNTIKNTPYCTALSNHLSCFACLFSRAYIQPLQHSHDESHPSMFLWQHQKLPAEGRFQFLLLAAHTVHWCRCTLVRPMHRRLATLGSSPVIVHFLRCIWPVHLPQGR